MAIEWDDLSEVKKERIRHIFGIFAKGWDADESKTESKNFDGVYKNILRDWHKSCQITDGKKDVLKNLTDLF